MTQSSELFDEHAPRDVPPLDEQTGQTLGRLVGVMRRLLAPGGCAWDRKQSYASLRKYVLEEACEVIDAIDSNDRTALREELGDLLLQVVFQAELARSERAFAIDDVISGIVEKLVSRHPHVFGDAEAVDEGAALAKWEQIKSVEKQGRGLLEGIPKSLPALARAERIGAKVAGVGFDWPDVSGSRAKVTEELHELDAAIAESNTDAIEDELGDVFFALANLARHVSVDPEAALKRTIQKFASRFRHVEAQVIQNHGGWNAGDTTQRVPLATLDQYWEAAKALERSEPTP